MMHPRCAQRYSNLGHEMVAWAEGVGALPTPGVEE